MQENVRQRLQHHCQQIFNKISFQEIFSVAGNILQDIFVLLQYVLECHITLLLVYKSVLRGEIFHRNCLSQCVGHNTFSLHMQEVLFLEFSARKRRIFSRPALDFECQWDSYVLVSGYVSVRKVVAAIQHWNKENVDSNVFRGWLWVPYKQAENTTLPRARH